jgi:hypothetical protein
MTEIASVGDTYGIKNNINIKLSGGDFTLKG